MTISSHDIGLAGFFQTTTIRSLVEAVTGNTTPEHMSLRRRSTVGRLTSDESMVRPSVVEVIHRILHHERGAATFIEAGVVEQLVSALSSYDQQIYNSAMEVLTSLSRHECGVHALVDAGIVEYITGASMSIGCVPKSSATAILGYVARTERGCEAIVKSGALAPLKDILQSDDLYTQAGAFSVFSSIHPS